MTIPPSDTTTSSTPLRTLPFPHRWIDRKFPEVMAAPPEERERIMVKRRMELLAARSDRQQLCPKCSLMKSDLLNTCVCDALGAIKLTRLPGRVDSFKFIVHMHVKERFRSSNSGKVIEQLYDAPVYLDSVPEDMVKMTKEIKDTGEENVFVLFPSEDAITVREAREKGMFLKCPTIIIVDGTWGQARRLNKNIPENVTRIKIEPSSLSKFACRTQTQSDRVCTVEAASILLEEMGFVKDQEILLEGLELVQRAFNVQTFHVVERPDDRQKKKLRFEEI